MRSTSGACSLSEQGSTSRLGEIARFDKVEVGDVITDGVAFWEIVEKDERLKLITAWSWSFPPDHLYSAIFDSISAESDIRIAATINEVEPEQNAWNTVTRKRHLFERR